ncbi:hypothetical protein CLV30_12877 [Haloactinopolyspora alba]|uniref:Uncharacterized protein n=1 Tax=Haloactinopolyspora alba TaxID=648780 RepID=A0A2P8DF23_9ACTN|nr:hypothetical protein [Haloactinopolyspora alba]PSK95825.1 hypothetical protein CLV30_12877 [Haloactinopolyspora alba]
MTRLAQLPPPVRAAIGAALLVDGWHPCPGECGTTVSPGHVGCRACWLRVPRHERAPLTAAFRNRTRDFNTFRRAEQTAADLIRRYATQEQP